MIFGAFERMVAFRYLRARRAEGFVSVIAIFSLLGIMLGVATLIIVMSVMNGFRIEFVNHILGIEGHLSVHVGERAAAPISTRSTNASAPFPASSRRGRKSKGRCWPAPIAAPTGVLVRGMRADDIAAQPLLAGAVDPAALAQFTDDGVLVGVRLAQRLGVAPGGQITIVSPNGNATAFGTMPRIKTYNIAGVFDLGMYRVRQQHDLDAACGGATVLQHRQRRHQRRDFCQRPRQSRRGARRARRPHRPVGAHRRLAPDPGQLSSTPIEIERNVMFLILTLIILVAAFNIISGMIMMVKDKGRDIAILRTMGATRGMILRIFILSGASIGVVGTFLGFVIGTEFALHIEAIRQFVQDIVGVDLFAAEIYFFTRIPAQVYASDVITVVAMAFALSFLATLYPSWRAARLDPVEALRYE